MITRSSRNAIKIEDLIGVKEGDGIVINGQTITFNGTSPANRSGYKKLYTGNNYEVQTLGLKAKKQLESVVVQMHLTIREGCGGTYKEVLDFHSKRI